MALPQTNYNTTHWPYLLTWANVRSAIDLYMKAGCPGLATYKHPRGERRKAHIALDAKTHLAIRSKAKLHRRTVTDLINAAISYKRGGVGGVSVELRLPDRVVDGMPLDLMQKVLTVYFDKKLAPKEGATT